MESLCCGLSPSRQRSPALLFYEMSTEERCTITFAGPDILVSMFEHSVIIASSNALTEDTLISAASKLLRSWPMLSYRVGLTVS